MHAQNVYKCSHCGREYSIPGLFVVDAQRKGTEKTCPFCENKFCVLKEKDVYPDKFIKTKKLSEMIGENLNKHLLDEDLSNLPGEDSLGGKVSDSLQGGVKASGGQYDQLINLGLGTAATVIANLANKPKNEQKQIIRAYCGRKPLFGKRKRQLYFDCVKNLMAGQVSGKTEEAPPPPPEKKFIGMPQQIGIPVFIFGVLILSALAFLAYRRFATKKA